VAKKFSPEWWLDLRPEQAGKETERLVEALLKERNERLSFAWHRMPDAKAARGALAAQPADYLVASAGQAFWLEVKALRHEFRLPRDRLTQLPVLKKFKLAGMPSILLVHHYTTQKWRALSAPKLSTDVPSWDLRPWVPCDSPEEALTILEGF